MRRHSSLLLLLATAVGVPAATLHCGASDAVGTSDSDHTAGEMLLHDTPYVFAETDYGTFQAQGGGMGLLGGDTLPADDIVTVRLQLWLDRFHDAVRTSVRKRTGKELAAPRPIAKVVLTPMANAWVTPVQGCAPVAIDMSSLAPSVPPVPSSSASGSSSSVPLPSATTGTTPPNAPARYAVPSGDSILTSHSYTCVTPLNWDPLGAPVWWSSLGKACSFEMTPDGKATARGASCTITPWAPSAENLVLTASSSFIHMTAKLIAMLDDERSVAAILAHELGHYYRAHVTRLGEYDYWYEQHSPPRPGKPPAVADSQQFGELFRKHAHTMQTPPIEGEKLSPRFRRSTSTLARMVATVPGIDTSCQGLATSLAEEIVTKITYGSPLAPEEAAAYVAFESNLLACAQDVRVTDRGDAGTLGWQPVNSLLGSAAGTEAQEPLPKDVTLAVLLQIVDARARRLDADAEAFRAEMNRRHLGHYTYEQEADDFSMELLSLAGLDPREHVEAWLGFTKALHDDPSTSGMFAGEAIPFEECVQLFHDGWQRKRADGRIEPVFVPMGAPHGHHGFCYRLFNLSRELLAHEYQVTGRGPETTVAWSAVQARAREAAVQPLTSPPNTLDAGAQNETGTNTGSSSGDADAGVPAMPPVPSAIIDDY